VSLADVRRHHATDHFAPGSIGPKIEAAIEFLATGGKQVVSTQPELAVKAMQGAAGTRIYA
jgi:carbamate kinase